MACPCLAKLKSIRAFVLGGIPASRSLRLAKPAPARRAYIMLRAPLPIASRKLPAPLAARRSKSIEALRFFSIAGVLQSFNLGKQTVPAEASLRLGGHRDARQFRAPAARCGGMPLPELSACQD